ncbi:unnamed protein product [Effrenium voratum]|nr:unnamed protein product [Effrenium voratum]
MGPEEQQMKKFREWLKEGGVDLQGVRFRQSAGGWGLFAGRAFREGEVVFEVPRDLCIEVPAANFELGEDDLVFARAAREEDADARLSPEQKEAVLSLSRQLLERRKNNEPYMAVLPDPPALHPLQLRWAPKLAAGSRLLQRMHATIQERDEACMEELLPVERVWKSRAWALGAVWTRAVRLPSRLALVPLMDFVNHWTPSDRTTETWSCSYDVAKDSVVVLAERRISKGEELTFLYGHFSDAQLLCNYGIPVGSPGRNAFDEAAVSIGPYVLMSSPDSTESNPAVPALVSARAACLARHGWALEIQRPLLFPVPRELRPSGGLLALARLLSLESAEEVEEWEHRIFWMDTPGAAAPTLPPLTEERAWRRVAAWLEEAFASTTHSASDFTDEMRSWPEEVERQLAESVTAVLVGEAAVLARAKEAAEARVMRASRQQGKVPSASAWQRRQARRGRAWQADWTAGLGPRVRRAHGLLVLCSRTSPGAEGWSWENRSHVYDPGKMLVLGLRLFFGAEKLPAAPKPGRSKEPVTPASGSLSLSEPTASPVSSASPVERPQLKLQQVDADTASMASVASSRSAGSRSCTSTVSVNSEFIQERIPARQRETAKIQSELKAFVREMVRGRKLSVIAPDGSLRSCSCSLDKRLKHFVIELKGSVRRIPLSEMTEVYQGNEPEDIETPLDELCATLMLESCECISFSFEDLPSRERFAMCLQILVDGQQ